MTCEPIGYIPLAIVGNRFRKRRRALPGQPDPYCHCPGCGPTPEVQVNPLFIRIGDAIQSVDHVLTPEESGTLFILEGAVTFTLPDAADDLQFSFFQSDNFTLAVQDSNAAIIVRNNPNAANVAYQTSGQKTGAACSLIAIQMSDLSYKWAFFAHCNHTLTAT